MAVTLNGLNGADPALAGGVTSGTAGTASGGNTAAGPAPARDTGAEAGAVNLTARATRLAELERALTASPAISSGRVQAASSALQDGTYRIEPLRIAQGLLRSDRLLGRLPTQGS